MISDKKKSYIKRAINYSLSIILTLVFLYIAFLNVNFSELVDIISNSSIFYIILFIILFYASHYVRAVRWKVILESVKPDVKMKNLFGSIMVGYGVNCVIPRLGEVSRAVLLGRWENLSKSSLFATVIVERVIDVIFFGISLLIAILISTRDLYSTFPWLKTTIYIGLVIMALSIVFLFLLNYYKAFFYRVGLKILSKLSKSLAEKGEHILDMLVVGFSSLKGAKNYFLTIAYSALILILYSLNSQVGFYILGMEKIKNIDFGMGWVIMSLSSIGVAIPTPGGTGSYHILTKETLTTIFGFSAEISLAYAFITHIISYIFFIVSAIVIFFILNKGKENNLINVVETKLDEV